MTDYVRRKFPEQIAAVEALGEKDCTFRSVCADYEELCTWAAERCGPSAPSSDECDHARELIRDLEKEILSLLRDASNNNPDT